MVIKTSEERNSKRIAWNNLQMHVPRTWDVRVIGPCHLVFEYDFQPLMQIRRQQSVCRSLRTLDKRINRWAAELGAVRSAGTLPDDLQGLADNFDRINCFYKADGTIAGGICLCPDCGKLILFHILATDPARVQEVRVALATLWCGRHAEDIWRIQDFSLFLPPGYTLLDYTFAAGLTRLSFSGGDHLLQTCTLGPADIRLQRQSLQEILTTLSDSPQLQVVNAANTTNTNYCEGINNPSIGQQIAMRLRRKKPFIQAAIRHDTTSNRLLAAVFSAKRPLAPTAAHDILHLYEIIQEN